MYSSQIKENCRTIFTGLKGKVNKEILQSVEGQLSDGIWENSPMMEGYWLFETIDVIDDEVVILISNRWSDIHCGKMKNNRFATMSDKEIKGWFANKIKQVIKKEIEWSPKENFKWNRHCKGVSEYMGYHKDISVQDCYKAYDILLERPEFVWFGIDN